MIKWVHGALLWERIGGAPDLPSSVQAVIEGGREGPEARGRSPPEEVKEVHHT